MRGNLILLAVSLLAAFAVLEGVLRLFYAVPPSWREPQVRHLESPLLGWVLPPNSRSYSIDAPVAINSAGLRDDELPREKPPGETRILALGDSFTFALGVRFEDLWVQQLERLLAERHAPGRFQVINAAVSGYNTRQELIYLLHKGLSWQPDLIVVGFYWNDLVGNGRPLPDLAAAKAAPPDADYLARDARAHLLPEWIRDPLRKSLVLYLSVTRAKTLRHAFSPSEDVYTRVQRALLERDAAALEPFFRDTAARLLEIAEAGRRHGIPTLLLVFPAENQVKRGSGESLLTERLREVWEPTGLPLIDLEPAFREAHRAGEKPFLPYDLHPSPAGMRIAAELLVPEIAAQGILDGSG